MSIAPAGTDEVAAYLRPRIEAAGGRLEMDVSDLAREFGFPRISSRRVPLIAAALEDAGVRTEPELTVEAVKVSLLVDGAARMPEPVAAPAEPEPPEPTAPPEPVPEAPAPEPPAPIPPPPEALAPEPPTPAPAPAPEPPAPAPLAAAPAPAPEQTPAAAPEHTPFAQDLWSRVQWSRFGPLVVRGLMVVVAGGAAFALGLLIGGLIS